MNKILLLFIVAALLAALATACTTSKSKGQGAISAEQVKQQMTDLNTLLLDVRTPDEYKDGHIPGAKNIPVQELDRRLNELDRQKNVIVYCRTGHRSTKAFHILKQNGFSAVRNFKGSWTEWTRLGYPIEK